MLSFLTGFSTMLTMIMPSLMTRTTGVLTGGATTGLDTALVEDLLDLMVSAITKFLGLFTIWPLNLFLVMGIVGWAINHFFIAKKAVKS